MSRIVIDASVAVKWFLTEPHSDDARQLLSGKHEMMAPELLLAEFGNVFWKRARSGEISDEVADGAVTAVLQMPLQIHPHAPLLAPALHIANRFQRSVYDSLYLALALARDARLVTADAKLLEALRSTPLAAHLLRVEDVT